MDDAAAIVTRFLDEVWNGRALQLAGDVVAPDYATHMVQADVVAAPDVTGADYVARDMSVWIAGFPDLRWLTEEVVAMGDRVAVRFRLTGIHRGAFLGVPATGAQIDVHGIYLARVADGRIAEAWLSWDRLGLFQQLGLVGSTAALLGRN